MVMCCISVALHRRNGNWILSTFRINWVSISKCFYVLEQMERNLSNWNSWAYSKDPDPFSRINWIKCDCQAQNNSIIKLLQKVLFEFFCSLQTIHIHGTSFNRWLLDWILELLIHSFILFSKYIHPPPFQIVNPQWYQQQIYFLWAFSPTNSQTIIQYSFINCKKFTKYTR